MNQDERRAIENQLLAMEMPPLDSPDLVQVFADLINGYPVPSERVQFLCDALNEAEGAQRREMYEALRPKLSFPVPSLDECEVMIAAKAERMIRPRGLPAQRCRGYWVEVEMFCVECRRLERFKGWSVGDAVSNARKAGWGRGPQRFKDYCAECRLATMSAQSVTARRLGN